MVAVGLINPRRSHPEIATGGFTANYAYAQIELHAERLRRWQGHNRTRAGRETRGRLGRSSEERGAIRKFRKSAARFSWDSE
jgi:hypothetical protein